MSTFTWDTAIGGMDQWRINGSRGSCVDGSDREKNMADQTNLAVTSVLDDLVIDDKKVDDDKDDDQTRVETKGGKGGHSNSGDEFEKFTDPGLVTPPCSLSELISCLHQVFSHDQICVEYVQKLMTSYHSNPVEWKKFAKFDKYKYTRNLVDEGNGKFNLMILCWNEAQGSSIHSHADSHCFLKVLKGGVREELYHWPDDTPTSRGDDDDNMNNGRRGFLGDVEGDNSAMRKKGEMRFDTNECTYINDSIGLHRVENESHVDKAVTLHLYSPPFQECCCFDQRSGRVSTAKMTFWSKFGKRTPYGKNPEKMEQPVEDN